MNLLVIEDDPRLVRLLKRLLEDDRHVVEIATDGATGLEMAEDGPGFECIILDVGLPDMTGLEVARRLRERGSQVAILMLTARDTVGDRVTGLDAGADDYLVKPFAFEELSARLRALSRRGTPVGKRAEPKLTVGPITLDEAARRVTVDDRAVDLSPREFSLLECLLRHPGQTLTRDQLLDQAWPFGAAVTPNAVDAYVHYLRDKLGPAGRFVETVRGVGYRLADAEAPELEVTTAEANLLRGVRVNLSLWSAGITLAVLVVVGVVLFAAVARSLEASGTAQLVARADQLTGERPDPDDDLPPGGFIFGGGGSGTYALIATETGASIDRPGPEQPDPPPGLPLMDGIEAVMASGGERDIREATIVVDVPVRVLTDDVAFRNQTLYLQVVGDRTTEVRTLTVLVVVLVVGGLAAVVVAAAVGAGFASRALVPIRRSLVGQREALRRQREFAADASHELRTPLTVIRASVDDLERHADQPVAAVGNALTDIRDEVDHMAAMVDDLLLLARSDSGAVALERVPLDLGDVASDGASAIARVAADRNVTVTVDPEPAELIGDPARLRQVVMILADNAVHHSPPGGKVAVTVRHVGGRTTLTVDDQGPGIRPEDRERVFDRFYRAAGAQGGGTGLGLAIAAWIVEGHGGRITAEDAPGGGARIAVVLPDAPA